MEKTSQRELLVLARECSMSSLMVELTSALTGQGPAIGLGEVESTHVPDRVSVVIATSGSTGNPKEVGLSSGALLASARSSNAFLGAKFGDTWSLLLPLTHIAGLNVLIRSMELGTTPLDLREAKRYPNANFTAIVPTQLFRALNGDDVLLTHLKNCTAVLVGGAALSQEVRQQAMENSINVVETYGMSETCGGCVYNGLPLNGVDVEISAEGLIRIRGPVLATGYLNDEGSWQSACIDGWFTTNDLGTISDGKLSVIGRADDVIISGGENISLTAVEKVLSAAFPHIESVAFGVPDSEWGSALHIACAGGSHPSEKEISSVLALSLGDLAKPKGVLFLEKLPLISIGKVDRAALAQIVSRERLGG